VYDAAGRVIYEIGVAGYVTGYTYDALGNPLTLTRYATAFNVAGHPQAFTAAEVLSLITANPQGRTITNVYDALGRVTETRQPAVFAYDSSAAADRR